MLASPGDELSAQVGYDFIKNEKYAPETRQKFGYGMFTWFALDAWGRQRTEEIYDELINLAPNSEIVPEMIKVRKEYLDGNDPALRD
jgi:hypothetical protein